MSVDVKHAYHSAIPDGGDVSVVQPSNWNASHAVTGTAKSVLFIDGTGHISEDNADFNYDVASHTLTVLQLVIPNAVGALFSCDAQANFNGAVNFTGTGVGIVGFVEVTSTNSGTDSTPLVAFYGSSSTYDGCIQSDAADVWTLGFVNVAITTVGPSSIGWDANCHLRVGAPTAAPGVSGAATVAGTDVAGVITLGVIQTAVTLTFGVAFTNVPFVLLSSQAGVAPVYTVTNSTIVIATASAGDIINYQVIGQYAG